MKTDLGYRVAVRNIGTLPYAVLYFLLWNCSTR